MRLIVQTISKTPIQICKTEITLASVRFKFDFPIFILLLLSELYAYRVLGSHAVSDSVHSSRALLLIGNERFKCGNGFAPHPDGEIRVDATFNNFSGEFGNERH